MQDGQTIADAQGNAAALIYTTITESPDDTPFETQMTPEMIETHKYYNDDILEIAEEMEQKLRELENAKAELATVEANIARFEAEGKKATRGGGMARARLSATDYVKRSEAAIAMYEQEIEREIDQVRNEYRRLAENLNSRAEMYRGDYDGLRRFQDNELKNAMRMRQDLVDAGVDPEGAARATQGRTEDGYHSFYVEQYAVTWGDYRLLQEGFAITTTREALMSIFWGAAELIALEIITAGLATAVVAAATGTRIGARLIRATASVGNDVLARLVARYNKLPENVKAKLDDIFNRIKGRDERPANDTGVTDHEVPRHADPRCQRCADRIAPSRRHQAGVPEPR